MFIIKQPDMSAHSIFSPPTLRNMNLGPVELLIFGAVIVAVIIVIVFVAIKASSRR